MKRVIRLTEDDLKKIIKKVITEQENTSSVFSRDDFDVKLFVKRRIPFINNLMNKGAFISLEKTDDVFEHRDNVIALICDYLYKESRVDFTNPQYDDMFEFVRELYGDIFVDEYERNQSRLLGKLNKK
jgi:hypothetical protein